MKVMLVPGMVKDNFNINEFEHHIEYDVALINGTLNDYNDRLKPTFACLDDDYYNVAKQIEYSFVNKKLTMGVLKGIGWKYVHTPTDNQHNSLINIVSFGGQFNSNDFNSKIQIADQRSIMKTDIIRAKRNKNCDILLTNRPPLGIIGINVKDNFGFNQLLDIGNPRLTGIIKKIRPKFIIARHYSLDKPIIRRISEYATLISLPVNVPKVYVLDMDNPTFLTAYGKYSYKSSFILESEVIPISL